VGAETPPAQPKIEFGVGGLVLAVPDYRGSTRYDAQAYPIPYLAYRTERLQVSREGVRARLFAAERLTASLSAAAHLPGNDDNPARAGMPEIDPTLEAGPSLDYLVHAGDPIRLRLRWPVRAAIAADDFEFKSIGWVTVPNVRLDYAERQGRWQWLYLLSLGAVWASEDYHEYFYGVAPQYQTPARPAYDAEAGYGGVRANLSATVRHRRWRVGVFGSYDWMAGAAFEDSPLFETEHSLVSGVFVTYRLYASGIGETLEGETP
jgi:outer membrane scaffolding protein for murein synthesis (MipA/OmpV family)